MKRSLSTNSINSDDSVIPIEVIPAPQQRSTRSNRNTNTNAAVQPLIQQTRSTRSSAGVHNNSNNSNTSLNNSNNNQQAIKRQPSLSPCSIVYVDSESTNLSEGTSNGLAKNDDDISSFASSDVAYSEKSSVNSGDSLRPRRIATHYSAEGNKKKQKLNYKFVAHAKEDHGSEIYCVQIFNATEANPECLYFATAGSNRISVYNYNTQGNTIELIDSFMDADDKEIYFSCCWTIDDETNKPLLAFGGLKGIIRTILPFDSKIKSALLGHGSSINDLRIHPTCKNILSSASKDYTIRLWNLKNGLCVCIFGGCEGHRDEVLSADFNLSGRVLVSCSIDHSLKIWNLDIPKIQNAIKESEEIDIHDSKKKQKFQTATHHFPDYTTRDVHTNYIDCVRWFGDLVLSKSCENSIILWKPGLLHENLETITRTNKNLSILHKFVLKECDIWYMRFSMDISQKILTLGTQSGKIYVWNLDIDDPNDIKQSLLTYQKSKRAIRSTALSLDGKYLIAVNDESYIWIWKND